MHYRSTLGETSGLVKSTITECATRRKLLANLQVIFSVFDDELLMTSTITGYTSARHGEKRPCNKLDEKKLGACEGKTCLIVQHIISI